MADRMEYDALKLAYDELLAEHEVTKILLKEAEESVEQWQELVTTANDEISAENSALKERMERLENELVLNDRIMARQRAEIRYLKSQLEEIPQMMKAKTKEIAHQLKEEFRYRFRRL